MKYPKRVAMLSMHTSPVARLGGKETGGMNVYVRELTRSLAQRGIAVDVFTRANDDNCADIDTSSLGVENARVINITAGPRTPLSKHKLIEYVTPFAAGIREFATQQQIKYDILHAHYWLSGVAAQCLQHMGMRAPVIQMFHTLGA